MLMFDHLLLIALHSPSTSRPFALQMFFLWPCNKIIQPCLTSFNIVISLNKIIQCHMTMFDKIIHGRVTKVWSIVRPNTFGRSPLHLGQSQEDHRWRSPFSSQKYNPLKSRVSLFLDICFEWISLGEVSDKPEKCVH